MNFTPRFIRAALFVAGLLFLAACGDDPTEVAVGSTTQTEAQPGSQESGDGDIEETEPVVADEDQPVQDDPEPQPGGEYERVAPRIELLNPVSTLIEQLDIAADDSTVLVRYRNASEPCSGARVSAQEDDTSVVVTLETGLDPNAAAMSCIAGVFGYEIALTLAAPLGERNLVAAAVDTSAEPDEDPFAGAEFPTDQYVGLTELEAMALGEVEQRVVRVTAVDGEFFIVTQDFSSTRVNIELEGGVVVNATSG